MPKIDKAVAKLLNDICAAFPEVRPLMDKLEDFMTADRMEAFADATTLAFSRNGDPKKGAAYLNFISQRLKTASPKELELIDVYYAEPLFHGSSAEAIRIGWPLVPQNIKDLYLKMWTYPPGELKKLKGKR